MSTYIAKHHLGPSDNADNWCVVALDDIDNGRGQPYRIEWHIDVRADIAIDRHLRKGEPITIKNSMMPFITYPVERIIYIRTID